MRSITELDEIGFDEYLFGNGICIIEWADMIQDRLPAERCDIYFQQGNSHNERIIRIEWRTA
jgi:tRNA threonylcarbamoyladenosine biosynthesis protein TsaE